MVQLRGPKSKTDKSEYFLGWDVIIQDNMLSVPGWAVKWDDLSAEDGTDGP